MTAGTLPLPRRANLLPGLHALQRANGWIDRASLASLALELRIPLAEAWEAATAYPMFRFEPAAATTPVCAGLSCVLQGGGSTAGDATGCHFRCYAAPASGHDQPFPEAMIREAGPLLAEDSRDFAGLERARLAGREAFIAQVEASGLRGRGGAYFPTARKWRSALAEERPIALVINAEEGEPGVFKDRALLGRRPGRFLEGLALAQFALEPEITIIFLNGEAEATRDILLRELDRCVAAMPSPVHLMEGAGGYVLGEESALLNAIEGRKPVPRVRPPYPVQAGLFGMPTVLNNAETIASLSMLARSGAEAFREFGTNDAPGTKLFSLSGRVARPGLYEAPLGTPLHELLGQAGGGVSGGVTAVLAGGPSGGFLAPGEFGVRLLPGLLHPTGAVAGSGGMVVFDESSDIRAAALAMAKYNADESCGKCTPCREGAPRAYELLERGESPGTSELLDALQFASLCGLGQMAPGPIRSALHFWPELFR